MWNNSQAIRKTYIVRVGIATAVGKNSKVLLSGGYKYYMFKFFNEE